MGLRFRCNQEDDFVSSSLKKPVQVDFLTDESGDGIVVRGTSSFSGRYSIFSGQLILKPWLSPSPLFLLGFRVYICRKKIHSERTILEEIQTPDFGFEAHIQEDKASGKSEKITITNEKGRLSQEIEKMVKEAEEYAEEDKKVKERIDVRNSLETYVYNMKNQVNDKDKLAKKLEVDDKEKIEATIKEALEWLDENQNAENTEYGEKLKEIEAVCNPKITAVYQKSGGAPGGGESGATNENEDEDESHDEL